MNMKDMYIIERRKKKIRLRQLAEYIGVAHLSFPDMKQEIVRWIKRK